MSAQSERGEQSTTCADRLLDNHVVISESRKSRLRSLVRKITPHSQVCRNTIYLPPALLWTWTTLFDAHGIELYYAYSAEARPNENVCAALSERLPSDYLSIRWRSGISGE